MIKRVNGWRGEAYVYPQIVYFAIQNKFHILMQKLEKENDIIHHSIRTPRDYQQQALILGGKIEDEELLFYPTGSGKTFVADIYCQKADRPTYCCSYFGFGRAMV